MKTMLLTQLLFSLSLLLQTALSQVTAAPSYLVPADGWRQRRGLRIQRRSVTTDWCSVSNIGFYCTVGTCIFGTDGYVGCCTASACIPRTECVDYTTGRGPICDALQGCFSCADPETPYCMTLFSAHQYVFRCGTSGLTSTVSDTTSSTTATSTAPSTISTSASPTAAPLPASTSATQPSSTQPSSTQPSSTQPSSTQPSPTSSETTTSVKSGSPTSQVSDRSAATTTSEQPDGVSASRGLIIGAVVGSCAGTVLLLVLLFLLWKYLAHRRATASTAKKDEAHRSGYTLGSNDDESTHQDKPQPGVGVGGMTEAVGPSELDREQAPSVEQGQPQYRCINPDSTTEQVAGAEMPLSWSTSPIPGVVEAPGDSPSTSSMASPALSNSSLWMAGSRGVTPRRQSQYQAYTPSVYTSGGQPPSSLARGGAQTQMAQSTSLAELEGEGIGNAR